MLTTFFFDIELTQDDLSSSNDLLHTTLLLKWEDYGCLFYHEHEIGNIISSLQKMTPKYKPRWTTAFSSFPKNKIEHVLSNAYLSGYSTYDDVNSDFKKNGIQVGIIAQAYNELYQRENNEDESELLLLTELNNSIYFSKSETSASSDIKENDNILDIWNNKFSTLSLYSKKITIIDRYLIYNAISDFKQSKKTSLETFIDLLIRSNKNTTIQILSACDINGQPTDSNDCISLMAKIKARFKNNNINIHLSLCNDRIFSHSAHDRYINFDNHTIQIGNGFELFRQSPIRNTTFNIKNKRKTNFESTYSFLMRNRAAGLTNL